MSYSLVIDDDADLLESLKATVRQHNLDVVAASTWNEGLSLFHVLSPNLVIADYNMPGSRHGLQLLAEIKQLRPSVRLILMSAYLSEEDMDRVESLGLVDRAFTKGSAVTTTEAILDEIARAAETADKGTDWVEFAKAHVDGQSVSQEALDELDSALKKNRLR
jgi:CheY-like chemotaxis protein